MTCPRIPLQVSIAVLLWTLIAFISPGLVAAQEVAGALQGMVISPSGSPEPQVTITISGPNMQGTRGTSTDSRGFYQFLALPPGTYELHVSRVGLQPMEVKQVVVELGRTTAVPALTVKTQPIAMEPIVVQAPAITLDPAHTEAGGTLRPREYTSLPVDRDYKSLITILPHANVSYSKDAATGASEQENVGGSTGDENQYYIDGTDVTDVATGGRATSLPYNFVRAVEVKTGGYEAQYGRALGAVVNALTYSGTNDFELSVFGFAQPGGLTMDARPAPGVSPEKPTLYDWGVRIGGPLVRDRLWYSAAVNPRAEEVNTEIVGFGVYTDRTEAVRFATKLTYQAHPSTNLELSVFGDPTTRDQVLSLWWGMTTVTSPDALLARVESGGTVASLRATVAPSPSVLLKASIGRQWDRRVFAGATEKGREESFLDYTTGEQGGGVREHTDARRNRTSLSVQGTFLLPGHTVVTGADYQDQKLEHDWFGTSILRQRESFYIRDYQANIGTVHNRSPAAYLQDSWRITERLTLSPGLRWSSQALTAATGEVRQRLNGEWQPRLGVSWLLGSGDTQRVFGSYGRFYMTLSTFMAMANYTDYVYIDEYYSTDPREPGAVPDSTFDGSYSGDYFKGVDGAQAENFDEFTLGYERVLGEETKLSVRGVRRDLRSAFLSGLGSDGVWVVGTPGEGDFSFLPPVKREYTALEIAADGAWSRWMYRTSYVLSRAWGNYPGLFNADNNLDQPGMGFSYTSWNQAENSTGLLPNDRTHVFKLSGAYDTRFGLVGGATLTYGSGYPINAFIPGPTLWSFWSYEVPRGSGGRTPALWDLSFRFGYDLPVARVKSAQIVLDLLHIGNPRRAVEVDEWHYLARDENGDLTSLNEQYKQPTAYQPPMAVRLGMQVDF